MHRQIVERQLELYPHVMDEGEREHLERFQEFVSTTPDCFERTHLSGHITASALICSPDMEKILLIHHKKLQKWLQLGGHADGHPNPAEVCLKEAQEESGLKDFTFFYFEEDQKEPQIFDLDIHSIPERKQEPEHYHYDLRFLLKAGDTNIQANEEANDLKWFTLEQARAVTQEESMLRQFRKFETLKKKMHSSPHSSCWKDL